MPKGTGRIVIDPFTNGLLTTLFGLEVVAVFAVLLALPGALPAGCPLTGPQAFAALAVTCLALFPLIGLVKLIAGHACALLSRTALAHLGDPVAKVKTRNKLRDQSWQMTIHSAMTALEAYILFVDGGGEHWLDDYRSLWTPHPHQQVNSKRSVHLLYLLQMAIWIVTCASHRFLEERHKDYVMMYVHHLVTIALFALSYGFNFVRIGTAVIFLHDSSDIVIDLLKMANYLKLEGRRGGFLVEGTFAATLGVWAYTRLYLYPVRIVWQGVWYGSREVVTAPGAYGMDGFTAAAGSPFTRGHSPGAKLGDGSFDLWANLRALPTHATLPGYWACGSLLTALLVMHVIWYMLLWRLLFRSVLGQTLHDGGADEYEGGSDDDHED